MFPSPLPPAARPADSPHPGCRGACRDDGGSGDPKTAANQAGYAAGSAQWSSTGQQLMDAGGPGH